MDESEPSCVSRIAHTIQAKLLYSNKSRLVFTFDADDQTADNVYVDKFIWSFDTISSGHSEEHYTNFCVFADLYDGIRPDVARLLTLTNKHDKTNLWYMLPKDVMKLIFSLAPKPGVWNWSVNNLPDLPSNYQQVYHMSEMQRDAQRNLRSLAASNFTHQNLVYRHIPHAGEQIRVYVPFDVGQHLIYNKAVVRRYVVWIYLTRPCDAYSNNEFHVHQVLNADPEPVIIMQ